MSADDQGFYDAKMLAMVEADAYTVAIFQPEDSAADIEDSAADIEGREPCVMVVSHLGTDEEPMDVVIRLDSRAATLGLIGHLAAAMRAVWPEDREA